LIKANKMLLKMRSASRK